MQKNSQTNASGVETTPDYPMNLDFYVQIGLRFIVVKNRFRQPPTTNELGFVKATEYDDLVTSELLTTLCEEQESLIEEQEEKIHDLETQLQEYEEEIYEKDQALQLAAEPKLQISRSNNNFQEESRTGGNQ